MKILRFVCALGYLAVPVGCSDTHRSSVDADGCSDGAACTCPDGRKGQQVCDVDTHELVMCECQGKSRGADSEEDAGSTVAHEDASVRPQAGHSAPSPAGHAADGGRSGSAAGAGGEVAADAGTPHHGKGQEKKQHKDAGKGDDQ